MILIDDCSADGTSTVIEHFCADDPRIRLIRRAEIGGRAAGGSRSAAGTGAGAEAAPPAATKASTPLRDAIWRSSATVMCGCPKNSNFN